MPVEVYGMTASAPCRIVTLTLEALKHPYEFKVVDLMKNENKTPEFLKVKGPDHFCNNTLNRLVLDPDQSSAQRAGHQGR